MNELSRYVFLAGSAPYIVLGVAHAFATPSNPDRPKGLSPRDPQLGEAMAKTALVLTRRTDMWKAWVGFNLSHSLGVVLFGVFVVLVGRSELAFEMDGPVFLPLAVLVSTGYLALAARFWFRTPIIGCALSVFLFCLSWILRLLGH